MAEGVRTVEIFVGDTALGLSATLLVNGQPQNLTGASVVSRIKPTGAGVYETAMAVGTPATAGRVSRSLDPSEVDEPLEAALEFVVTFADGTKATWPSASEEPALFIVRARRT